MDIAALSMAMAQNDIGTKVGIAILDKNMETAESQGAQIVQMIDSAAIQRSVQPHLGGNIDISVQNFITVVLQQGVSALLFFMLYQT